jgi:hypothetical protein
MMVNFVVEMITDNYKIIYNLLIYLLYDDLFSNLNYFMDYYLWDVIFNF